MEQKDIEGSVSKTNTFSLVIGEISKLSNASPDGFTVAEMIAATGHCGNWCREKIRALMASGKVVCIGRRTMEMVDGRSGKYSPVYRLTDG